VLVNNQNEPPSLWKQASRAAGHERGAGNLACSRLSGGFFRPGANRRIRQALAQSRLQPRLAGGSRRDLPGRRHARGRRIAYFENLPGDGNFRVRRLRPLGSAAIIINIRTFIAPPVL
jgi:hypothetical protein